MSTQSFLARNGIRTGILGSTALLAFSAPVSDTDSDADSNSYASRIGMYFDRTGSQERMGVVILGTETVQFR